MELKEYQKQLLDLVNPPKYANERILQTYFVHNFDKKKISSFETFFEEYQIYRESPPY